MKRLNRGPSGQFISRWEALTAWLPNLLQDSYIDTALEILAKHAQDQAAHCFRLVSDDLKRGKAEKGLDAGWPRKRAERWLKKRDILLDAKEAFNVVDKS